MTHRWFRAATTSNGLRPCKRTGGIVTRPYFRLERSDATVYETSVYSITSNLWRWEIRCGGALLRCGTAPSRAAAEMGANEFANT
jgi:hypothetical protein